MSDRILISIGDGLDPRPHAEREISSHISHLIRNREDFKLETEDARTAYAEHDHSSSIADDRARAPEDLQAVHWLPTVQGFSHGMPPHFPSLFRCASRADDHFNGCDGGSLADSCRA